MNSIRIQRSRYLFLAVMLWLLIARVSWADTIFYGVIDDPDGYTNVRAEPNINSEVVLLFRNGMKFLFEPSAETNWWRCYTIQDPPQFRGYIHNSRVKKLSDLNNVTDDDSVETSVNVQSLKHIDNTALYIHPSDIAWEAAVFYGLIDDPDGYVNVREQANGNSAIVDKIVEEERFLFEPNASTNWWKVYSPDKPPKLSGYVHKSRIKQAPGMYSVVFGDSVDRSVVVLTEKVKDFAFRFYPSNRDLFALPGDGIVSANGLIYEPETDKWISIFPDGNRLKNSIASVSPDGRILAQFEKNGFYHVSEDRGKTWQVLPRSDSCRVFPHAEGYLYVKDSNKKTDSKTRRPVYHSLAYSVDMGKTWRKYDRPVSSPDLEVDHHDLTIYSGPWVRKNSTESRSEFTGGIYTSSDTGRTWNHLVSFNEFEFVSLEILRQDERLYVNCNTELSLSEDNGKNWRLFSADSGDAIPDFINSISVSAGKVHLFTHSHVYIADLDLNNIRPHQICAPLTDWPDCEHSAWFSPYISSAAVTESGQIYVSRFEGVYHSRDGGLTFKQLAVDNSKLSGRAICTYSIGDTVYVGMDTGLGISHDGGKTFRTVTKEQGLAERTVSNVHGDGRGFVVASGGSGFAYSTDGGRSFIPVTHPPVKKCHPPGAITLAGNGSNALLYSNTFPLHVLRRTDSGVEIKKSDAPASGIEGADIDISGKLIVICDYYKGIRFSRDGFDGEWLAVGNGEYSCVGYFYNSVHITDEGAIYVICRPKNSISRKNGLKRNTTLLCSYDNGHTWFNKDFSGEGINLFGFDSNGNLIMRYRFPDNRGFDFQSRDFGISWNFIKRK